MSLADQNNNLIAPYVWYTFATGTNKVFDSMSQKLPTDLSGISYKMAARALMVTWCYKILI